mmetsp:Transcript_36327/g.71463  ORF Transcript_36327/g.71463 Transcript_36327/m.71463 type:complete len:80 (+) Transcript_36327:417-656(+)
MREIDPADAMKWYRPFQTCSKQSALDSGCHVKGDTAARLSVVGAHRGATLGGSPQRPGEIDVPRLNLAAFSFANAGTPT